MECTKFAYDLDDDVLDIQTTTTYDADGNVVGVIEQNATNDLAEDDVADEPLVLGTDRVEFDAFGDVVFAGEYHFDGLEIEVDDNALQYHAARCYDPSQGRWLNQEPLGFEAAQDNMFRYPSAAQQ